MTKKSYKIHRCSCLRCHSGALHRFQVLAVQELGEFRSFKYPKFHANSKYAALIRWLGSATLADASAGEGSHKRIKAAYLLSNKKAGGLEQQVRGQ